MRFVFFLGFLLTGSWCMPEAKGQGKVAVVPTNPANSSLATPSSAIPRTYYGGAIAAADLAQAASGLYRSDKLNDVEPLVERVVRQHPNDWQVLFEGARIYAELERNGYWVDGVFKRGDLGGTPPKGAQRVYSHDRDHTRAMQLMERAIYASTNELDSKKLAEFYWEGAQLLIGDKAYLGLYELSDLSRLPTLSFREPTVKDREPVPVDDAGNPIFFEVPISWDKARNDGERLLWLLKRARTLDPSYDAEAEFIHAKYLLKGYLDVQSVTESKEYDPVKKDYRGDESAAKLLDNIDALSDDETIARVGTGLRRITLPDQHNFLKRLRVMVNDSRYESFAGEALEELAECYENRRQYEHAAQYWDGASRRFGVAEFPWEAERLAQIEGNWGAFEDAHPVQAGDPVTLGYWFRNGSRVDFKAHRLDVSLLVEDILLYLRSDPFPLDPGKIDVSMLGRHLVEENGEKYLKERVSSWDQTLAPAENHWDRRIDVNVPLNQPGAYLVEATIENGNTSTIIVWINDMTILRRPLEHGVFYYVADKRNGTPVGWAKFSFIGFRLNSIHEENTEAIDQHGKEIPEALRRQYHVTTKEISKWADAKGQLTLDDELLEPDYRWFLLTTAPGNRAAILGFSDIKPEKIAEPSDGLEPRFYHVLDRDAYLPGQAFRYQAWLRLRRQTPGGWEFNPVSESPVSLAIIGADRQIVDQWEGETDALGALRGEWTVPKTLLPGRYQLVTLAQGHRGVRAFDVYTPQIRKAKLEASLDKMIHLRGEPVSIALRAEDLEGKGGLANGIVRYVVKRSRFKGYWYPENQHDWLFRRGYAHVAPDYGWLPGWERWGWPGLSDESTEESVSVEGTVTLDADGLATLTLGADVFQARDGGASVESFEVSFVVEGDRSVASEARVHGTVADLPLKVYGQLDKAYYKVGEHAVFQAWVRDWEGAPQAASGHIVVREISLQGGQPGPERELYRVPMSTDESGHVEISLGAHLAGLYRTSFEFRAQTGELVEGSAPTFVAPGDFTGEGGQFGVLEFVSDRSIYAPGDTVGLRINTDHPGQSVAMFVRPRNGVFGKAEVIRLEHRSTLYEIRVGENDVPSFHVEAIAFGGGTFHVYTKEIVVSPPKPIIDVAITTDKAMYQGGDEAIITLAAKDQAGVPIEGQAIVSLVPRLSEEMVVASGIPRITQFYGDTRKTYSPSVEHALKTSFQSFAKPPDQAMQPIGFFGAMQVSSEAEPAVFEELEIPSEDQATPGDLSADYSDPRLTYPVVWMPGIKLDDEGRAQVTVSLPTAGEAWECRAWVLSENGHPGEATKSLMLDGKLEGVWDVPEILVVGDSLQASLTVFNRSCQSLVLTGSLSVGEGLSLEEGVSNELSLTLEPRSKRDLSWKLRAASPVSETRLGVHLANETVHESWETTVRVLSREAVDGRAWSRVIVANDPPETVAIGADENSINNIDVFVANGVLPAVPQALKEWSLRASKEPSPLDAMAALLPLFQWQRYTATLSEEANSLWSGDPALVALRDPEVMNQRVVDLLGWLAEHAQADGGWGVVSDPTSPSDVLMTAFIVHGLSVFVEGGIEAASSLRASGLAFLREAEKGIINRLGGAAVTPADQALAAQLELCLVECGKGNSTIKDVLYKSWKTLPSYAQLLLAASLHLRKLEAERNEIRFYLGEQLVKDERTGAIGLKSEEGLSSSIPWYGQEPVVLAAYLDFLLKVKGDNPVADAVALELMSRRSRVCSWGSSRDSALVLGALIQYAGMKKSAERVLGGAAVSVQLDDRTPDALPLSGEHLPGYVSHRMEKLALPAGEHRLMVSLHDGDNALVVVEQRSVSEPVLLPETRGDWRVRRDCRIGEGSEPLEPGVEIRSGQWIEVALTVTLPEPVSHFFIEEHVPGGFFVEPSMEIGDADFQERSGGFRLAFPELAGGDHVIRYRMRAGVPGRFRALPAVISSAFSPMVKGNSSEMVFFVGE